jgi:hypothetical protein
MPVTAAAFRLDAADRPAAAGMGGGPVRFLRPFAIDRASSRIVVCAGFRFFYLAGWFLFRTFALIEKSLLHIESAGYGSKAFAEFSLKTFFQVEEKRL